MLCIVEYLLPFRDIQVFVQKLLTSQTERMTVINHKIENISENIGWVLFKLGTSNLHQLRHKVTTTKMLLYQHTGFQSLSALNKISRILNRNVEEDSHSENTGAAHNALHLYTSLQRVNKSYYDYKRQNQSCFK